MSLNNALASQTSNTKILVACYKLLESHSKKLTLVENESSFTPHANGVGFKISAFSSKTGIIEKYLQIHGDEEELLLPNGHNVDVTDVASCLKAFETIHIYADYVWDF